MNPLAIFSGPYAMLAKWGVIALLVVAVWVHGWVKGNAHGTEKLNEHVAKQAIEAVRIAKGREKVTTEVVTQYVRVRGATEVVTRTVEKEVIRYADANPGYCLDSPWRVLHDDAASNRVPGAGLKPDGALREAASAGGGGGGANSGGGAENSNGKLR